MGRSIERMTRQFKQRLLASSLGILALVICIYYSFTPSFKPIFVLFFAGIISIALFEYYQLAQRKGFRPSVSLGIGSTIVYFIGVAFYLHYSYLDTLPSFILLGSLLLLFLIFFNQYPSSIGNLAVTLFGIVYLTIPLSCALRINYFFPDRAMEDGRIWLAYVLIVS